tara:strand:+ start:859 stop:1581 length:723 start_codon:yes stop_codon:yes gene_type:complete
MTVKLIEDTEPNLERPVNIVYTTCNNCGAISSFADLNAPTDYDNEHAFSTLACCGRTPNSCMGLHNKIPYGYELLNYAFRYVYWYGTDKYGRAAEKTDLLESAKDRAWSNYTIATTIAHYLVDNDMREDVRICFNEMKVSPMALVLYDNDKIELEEMCRHPYGEIHCSPENRMGVYVHFGTQMEVAVMEGNDVLHNFNDIMWEIDGGHWEFVNPYVGCFYQEGDVGQYDSYGDWIDDNTQ